MIRRGVTEKKIIISDKVVLGFLWILTVKTKVRLQAVIGLIFQIKCFPLRRYQSSCY